MPHLDLATAAVLTLNGLASASTLFVVASGLSLIFGVTRIVNFAHGSFYMLGAFVGRTALKDGKGVMTGFHYADGANFMPSDDEVRKLRPAD